jgi:integrase
MRRYRRVRGEGSISRRSDGRWEGRLSLGLDQHGRRIRRAIYGATRQEVAAKLGELASQHRRGLLAEPSTLTLAEYAGQWMERKSRELRPASISSYQRRLTGHVLPALGNLKLQAIRPAHVQGFLDELAKAGLGPRSQRLTAWLLSTILDSAVRVELIPRNPAVAVRVNAAPVEPRLKAWTRGLVTAFVAAADGDRLYPAFLLALTTGLRRGELLGLRWQDVNLDKGMLRVEQTATIVEDRIIFSQPKTASSRRTVYIGPGTVQVLRAHRDRQAVERADAMDAWADPDTGPLVFPTMLGGPVHGRNFAHTLAKLAAKAGVPNIGPHGLRHTYTSLARASGTALEVVSKQLGHARVSITADIYRSVYAEERQAAALDVTDLLARPGPRGQA